MRRAAAATVPARVSIKARAIALAFRRLNHCPTRWKPDGSRRAAGTSKLKKKSVLLISFAAVSTLAAKAASFAASAKVGDDPKWLSAWALGHRAELALFVFGLAAIGSVIEILRAYLDDRHQFKRVIEHLVDDCAKHTFPDRQKQNRLTVFKVTAGWRMFFWSLVRLPVLGKPHKWRAAFRLRWGSEYLGVYHRPALVRNRKSSTALRVSDSAEECEGMAGQVYEEGFCLVSDLPTLTKQQVAVVSSLESLPSDHPVVVYARATRITSIELLKSFENFGRHFIGVVIRNSDGRPWGVLLVDSEESKCPFPLPSGGGVVKDKLDYYARIIGKLVA